MSENVVRIRARALAPEGLPVPEGTTRNSRVVEYLVAHNGSERWMVSKNCPTPESAEVELRRLEEVCTYNGVAVEVVE